jgi:NAD(P)-dependent dehydrogenase (short-subunit alcohol dehydrogenase family)
MTTKDHPVKELPGAVITGSSRGIGAAIARRLARAGYGVSINYLEQAGRANALVQEIEQAGGRAVAIRADVGDYNQVCTLVEETAERFSGIRIVVNNAGFSQHRTIDEMTIEDWNRAIAVNLSAALYTVKAALSYLKAESWGRIVSICSLRAMTGSNHGAHYAAAKAGLIGLTKSLALELAPKITANAVSPGYTNTEMNAAALAKSGDAIRAKIPAHRVAEPDEIAALVCFLASEEAGYITGETINANGGIYMR